MINQVFDAHAADNGQQLEYAEMGITNEGLLVHYNIELIGKKILPDVFIP